jgi:23S rRNA pseudouridine1911/1915/1917 synthase
MSDSMNRSNETKIVEIQASAIPEHLSGSRLDHAACELYAEYSRTVLKKCIDGNTLRLNGAAAKPSTKVKSGDKIELEVPHEIRNDQKMLPQKVDFDLIAENQDFIVVNKPSGIVVHPGAGNPDRTLLNGIINEFPELQHLPRGGLIHRIDKNTSGLLLVARNIQSYTFLSKILQKRAISRIYLAVVNGVMVSGGSVEANIRRDNIVRTRMKVSDSGRYAKTNFRILKKYRAHTLLEVQLETGRTHQIRVHMASIGHPILGDTTYGARPHIPKNPTASLREIVSTFSRQALHAKRLEFIFPEKGKKWSFVSRLPSDLNALIAALDIDAEKLNS